MLLRSFRIECVHHVIRLQDQKEFEFTESERPQTSVDVNAEDNGSVMLTAAQAQVDVAGSPLCARSWKADPVVGQSKESPRANTRSYAIYQVLQYRVNLERSIIQFRIKWHRRTPQSYLKTMWSITFYTLAEATHLKAARCVYYI